MNENPYAATVLTPTEKEEFPRKRLPLLVRLLLYLLGSSSLAMGLLLLLVEWTEGNPQKAGTVFGTGLGLTFLALGGGFLFLARQNWQVMFSGSLSIVCAAMALVGISKELEDYLQGQNEDLLIGLGIIGFLLACSAIAAYTAAGKYRSGQEH